MISKVKFDECDYLAFSDHDDIWRENKLDKACKEINTNEAEAYPSDVVAFWINVNYKYIKSRIN